MNRKCLGMQKKKPDKKGFQHATETKRDDNLWRGWGIRRLITVVRCNQKGPKDLY